jgi:hypothetical protein
VETAQTPGELDRLAGTLSLRLGRWVMESRDRARSAGSSAPGALSRAINLKASLDQIEAVPPARAAALLGVSVRTVYRRLGAGRLEQVPRHGRGWVSVRSLERELESRYASTQDFNALDDIP